MSKPNFFCAALSMSKWSRGSTNELERPQASTQLSLTIGRPTHRVRCKRICGTRVMQLADMQHGASYHRLGSLRILCMSKQGSGHAIRKASDHTVSIRDQSMTIH